MTTCHDDIQDTRKTLGDTATTRIIVSEHSLDEPMNFMRGLILKKLMQQRPGIDPAFVQAGGNTATQAEQLRHLLDLRPAVLILFPEEMEPLAGLLSTALLSGTKVIVIGKKVDPQLCTTCIFADDKKIGALAGEYVIEALKKKSVTEGLSLTSGRVVQLTGKMQSHAARERSAGFVDSIKKEPGVVLVHDAPGDWDAATTKLRLAEALRIQKNFDVVFTHSDIMARAVHQVLMEKDPAQREHILVLGVDGQPGKNGGMQMITNGEVDATIFNPPLVDLAWNIIQKMLDDPAYKPKPAYELESFMVTSEKVFELSRKQVPTPEP